MTKEKKKPISGVYKITNLVNGKFYIGSSVNINKRWIIHRSTLRRGLGNSGKLQNSWNKYGEENFLFEVLVTCPIEYTFKLEQWFLTNLKPNYNHTLVVSHYAPGKKHTEDSKKKMGWQTLKYTEKDILKVRDLKNNGMKVKDIVINTGISKTIVIQIIHKRGRFKLDGDIEDPKIYGVRVCDKKEEIINLYKTGKYTQLQISKIYGCTPGPITNILKSYKKSIKI